MIKRAYMIKLREDVQPDRLAVLRQVLEAAPRYIRTMRWSRLHREASQRQWDLVWDTGFDDEAGYWEYLVHPYHCNQIDDLMYRESPINVVDQATALRWDDSKEFTLEQTESPYEPPQVPEADGNAYVLEQVLIAPGRTNEYLAALEQDYLPLAAERGLRLVGSWRAPEGGGEDEVTLLWVVGGMADYHRIRVAFNFDEPAFSAWIARIKPLRTGGRRRVMRPTAGSPLS